MSEIKPHSFTFKLTAEQQDALIAELGGARYTAVTVPYTRAAADGPECRIALYTTGKCVVQGRGAQDWVQFVLEPEILREVVTGYDDVRNPDFYRPHLGVDESGKGDFFGPLVIAAVYTDDAITRRLQTLGVKDSKQITSDARIAKLADGIRDIVGRRQTVVPVGPRAYNRLYARMGSVNRLLGWGHARAMENVLEQVPDCPRAVADQFGPEDRIRRALLQRGRKIELIQRHKAESDPAVAAASILARDGFVRALAALEKQHGRPFPKGASAAVRAAAVELVRAAGPAVLLDTAKCHFKTADEVLAAAGHVRDELGPDGAARSQAYSRPPA